eukprot:Gb_18813 [translate_table: standard]
MTLVFYNTTFYLWLCMSANWCKRASAMYKYVLCFGTICALFLYATVLPTLQGSREEGTQNPILSRGSIEASSQPDNKIFQTDHVVTTTRRLLIGSTAPICTYNECRGCKTKCRAEQVPVDANDPLNSAYHYRCICHK